MGFYLLLPHNLILLKVGLKMDHFPKWVVKKNRCEQNKLTNVLSPKIKPNQNGSD